MGNAAVGVGQWEGKRGDGAPLPRCIVIEAGDEFALEVREDARAGEAVQQEGCVV